MNALNQLKNEGEESKKEREVHYSGDSLHGRVHGVEDLSCPWGARRLTEFRKSACGNLVHGYDV